MFLVAIVLEGWGMGAVAGGLVAYLALAGGWIWALLVAVRGSRRGLFALALFSLFSAIAGASDLLVFCPSPCQGLWPLAEASHWSSLLYGLLAAVAVAAYLWRKRAAR